MIHELHEPFLVDTPLGRGYALLIEACAHEYWWTVALNDGGGLVTFTQDRIRVARSYSYRRDMSDTDMAQIVRRPGDNRDKHAGEDGPA